MKKRSKTAASPQTKNRFKMAVQKITANKPEEFELKKASPRATISPKKLLLLKEKSISL